jgi:hypothetical protein
MKDAMGTGPHGVTPTRLWPRSGGLGWLVSTRAGLPDGDAWLTPDERAALAGLDRSAQRAASRLERYAAKLAVARWLGAGEGPADLARFELIADGAAALQIRRGDAPAGMTLALSRRQRIALVAVGPAGAHVGCSLEVLEPRGARFLLELFRVDEAADVLAAPPPERDARAALYWSAKQSACQALRCGDCPDTAEVAISLATGPAANGWARFEAACPGGPVLHGFWRRLGEAVLTLAGSAGLEPRALRREADPPGSAS